MKFIKAQEWLKDHLRESELRIIDCRFTLGNPEAGRIAYEQSHIPGSVYFDLERDLSSSPKEHGGRHPLPDLGVLREKIEKSGINNNTTVIVYDNGEGSYAGRFWWILTFMGHAKVYILDGGFSKWIKAKREVTKEIPYFKRRHFDVNVQDHMLVSYEEVKQISQDKSAILIDSRGQNRFIGLEEPIDRRPGHIPGAINIVWEDGFENGYWKSGDKQLERFIQIDREKPLVVYCGSGVTATPNYIALKEAGFENVKLYAGSYSDWVSYEENPVELGE